MIDLIERLIKAASADRELDRDIADALGFGPGDDWERPKHNAGVHNMNVGDWIKGSRLRQAPRYTGSVDIALQLFERLLPDWRVENLCQWQSPVLKERGQWMCDVVAPGDIFSRQAGKCSHAPTPAIALCLAILKAQHAVNSLTIDTR